MRQLTSSLTDRSAALAVARQQLEAAGFVLGGNWEYDHGYFDCALDDKDQVWLRIPFRVIDGKLDSEREDNPATIRFGTPFALKHLYNDGLDRDNSTPSLAGSFVNQFQEPVDADAQLEEHWVAKAEQIVRELERKIEI